MTNIRLNKKEFSFVWSHSDPNGHLDDKINDFYYSQKSNNHIDDS